MTDRAQAAKGRSAEQCRALARKRTHDYVAHLVKHSTMPARALSLWTSLLTRQGELSADSPEITWRAFADLLRKTQRDGAPRFPFSSEPPPRPPRRDEGREGRARGGAGGNWFTDVLLCNADLLEHLGSKHLEKASAVALRETCKLPAAVTRCLLAKCTRLIVAGTKEHFPHGRSPQRVAFVGVEKEVGVAVALAEPHAPGVIAIGDGKWCVDATVASKFAIEGLRSRGASLRKIQVEGGEAWHTPLAGMHFEQLPEARMELRVAGTDEVVRGGMMPTRRSTVGLLDDDGGALNFRLGIRYEPPRSVGRDENGVAHYTFALPSRYGPSVATVYVGFKLAPKLLQPPYRKKAFYLRVAITGEQRRDGKRVDVRLASRSEVFEVRRRAAPRTAAEKKAKVAARA